MLQAGTITPVYTKPITRIHRGEYKFCNIAEDTSKREIDHYRVKNSRFVVKP